jgi:hypothetical protein
LENEYEQLVQRSLQNRTQNFHYRRLDSMVGHCDQKIFVVHIFSLPPPTIDVTVLQSASKGLPFLKIMI